MGGRRVIYESPSITDELRQGDIFVGLPRIEISLAALIIAGEDGERVVAWEDLARDIEPVTAMVPLRSVACIVATQDCDASRSADITLCEIRQFRKVEGKCKETRAPKKWKNIITQHARINQKWFYLPPDNAIGFTDKMAVDFMVTMRMLRSDLLNLLALRKGRLNRVATEHFRERISEFYRRYPYDEWYSLNEEELSTYTDEYPDAEPFPWQKTSEDS